MSGVLKPTKPTELRERLMRLTDRDVELLSDLGTAGVMTYRQIQALHFSSYISCAKRVRMLQMHGYMQGAFYNTNEKVFTLDKEAIKTLLDLTGKEFKIETYDNVYHKVMRSELYVEVKNQNVCKWVNEAQVKETDSIYDVYFEHNEMDYFCEIHNTQSSKQLRKKLERALKLEDKFCMLIYCRNKDVVRGLLEKMNAEGFSDNRTYAIKVFEYGDKVNI